MQVSLARLRTEDAEAIVDAEDADTIRWLSGGVSTVEGAREYVARLVRNAADGATKRAFGIWVDGACVGTIDFDAEVTDGLDPGDVNIAYGIAPWMRGRGITVLAVDLVCGIISERGLGSRAATRADLRNPASARVAVKAGFSALRDVVSATDVDEDGQPTTLASSSAL